MKRSRAGKSSSASYGASTSCGPYTGVSSSTPDLPEEGSCVKRRKTTSGSYVLGTGELVSEGPSKADSSSPKKGKNAAKEPKEQPEKRGAVFKSRCPQNIRDRVERVMTQRYKDFVELVSDLPSDWCFSFFMISRNRIEGELREDFDVLGSTGNVASGPTL
jgi:hypothetical protein